MTVSETIEIHVENFKSLKSFKVAFDNFNVLIGANGSGKTNILELFKFANMCICPSRVPAYPFRAWSGFKNIVWAHDTDSPIRIHVKHSADKHNIEYMGTIAGSDGQVEYLDETLDISNYLSVTRNIYEVKFNMDIEFLEEIKPILNHDTVRRAKLSFDTLSKAWTSEIQQDRSVLPWIQEATILPFLMTTYRRTMQDSPPSQLTQYNPKDVDFFSLYEAPIDQMFTIPSVRISNGDSSESFIHQYAVNFFTGELPIILLRQLNYAALRTAPSAEGSARLSEDGAGLINTLFRWYNSHTGIPDRITLALESLFPEWQISFTVTDDGRILLSAHDGNVILYPPSIPDGFYKLLAILAAIELKPKFLLIDEIESSLHAKMIEYIIGELKDCDSKIVITTHSPVVIDAVQLEDLILLERTNAGTTSRRINNPEKIRKKLRDLGVTVSEGWLYGKI